MKVIKTPTVTATPVQKRRAWNGAVALMRVRCVVKLIASFISVPVRVSGESVCENLTGLGVKLVTSETAAEMRLCTSLVDERFGETTEIIEPWSAEVTYAPTVC